MRLYPTLLCCLAALALAGCDNTADERDAGDHDTRIQGESQVDGEFDQELSGDALFAVVTFADQGVDRFEIQLQSEEFDRYHQVTLDFHDADPPRARSFPCDAPSEGEQNEVTLEYVRVNGAPYFLERFRGSEGEVVITDVSDSEIRGTIDCTLISGGGTRTVAVTGSFRAREGG